MIRPPGIDNGAFVVSPDSVLYARVLLLFSASAMTDSGSKFFECALVSKPTMILTMVIKIIILIVAIIHMITIIGIITIIHIMCVIVIMLIIAYFVV